MKKSKSSDGLIGSFFHVFRQEQAKGEIREHIQYQGVVLNSPQPGYYLVLLFDWIGGDPLYRRLASIAEMTSWVFYETADQMRAERERFPEQGRTASDWRGRKAPPWRGEN